MHILIIRSLNPFFETGASANRYSGIINGLLKNNIKVTLLIIKGYNDFSEYKAKGYKFQNPNLTIHYTAPILNHNIWLRRINTYLIGGIINRFNQIVTRNYYNKHYDFIWLTYDNGVLYTFNKNFNLIHCKTIIELNEFNDLHKEVTTGNKLQRRKALNTENIFNNAIIKIDYLAVMTKTLIAYYRKMAKPDAKFFHFPMTVDFNRFQNVAITEKYIKPYIAYTGTYTNLKDGVDILIKSFSKIASKYPQYHLYLAGFYHYDMAMQKELISKLGLQDRITYLNVLEKDSIPEFICNADLLVLSRPDSHQARGGFPTKLGEYLASGKPVCVTKVGEIPDYLVDNTSAFMASPGDVESFADAMDRALSDKPNSIRVGLNGQKVAEKNFSIYVQIMRCIEFLKKELYEN